MLPVFDLFDFVILLFCNLSAVLTLAFAALRDCSKSKGSMGADILSRVRRVVAGKAGYKP